MSVGFIFWLLILLALLFGVIGSWPNPAAAESKWKYLGFGGNLLYFILIVLLGIRVFGWPITG